MRRQEKRKVNMLSLQKLKHVKQTEKQKAIGRIMDYKGKYKEVFNMNKADLLYLIENLMVEGKLDISDIAISHTKALERKLAAKDEIINQADNCIFESVFTDSLGKPADDKAMQRKLEWLDKVGTHNMDGIFKYLRNEGKVLRS